MIETPAYVRSRIPRYSCLKILPQLVAFDEEWYTEHCVVRIGNFLHRPECGKSDALLGH